MTEATVTRLRCQWCGAEGPPDEFELDTQHNDGFWCPDCDGHTFFDDARNKRRRALLLLETADETVDEVIAPRVPRKLRKRLSPMRYPGGKSHMAEYIASLLYDAHRETFVEAFAGGASVGLSLLDAGIVNRLILNDADRGVYAFWKTATERPQELLWRLRDIKPCADTFYDAQAVLDVPEGHSEPELAWAQLVCNRLAFSGITKAGLAGGKHGGAEKILDRWNPAALAKRISDIASMSERITVTRQNAAQLIEESGYWSPDTTLFVDPPYVAKGRALYREFFTEDDHRALAATLESLYTGIPGADVIITYDDCPLIRDIYWFAETKTVLRRYCIAQTRKTA